MSRKILASVAFVSLSFVSVSMAADDPVATRKAIMQANGAAAGLSAGMMKQEIDYQPALGKAAITTFNATAHSFDSFFPEESRGAEGSTAAPAIWEDMDAFKARMADFLQKTEAAAEVSGKDGPADLATFQGAVQPILGECKECHEKFRVKK